MPTLSMLPNEYPDPYYAIRKIRAAIQFIDHNGTARINKVPISFISGMLLETLKDRETFSDAQVFADPQTPSLFYCFSVFHHIYLKYYREYDLTSLDNCQAVFIEFQHFLWKIVTIHSKYGRSIQEKLPGLKLFDLKNMAENIDAIKQWERNIQLSEN